MKSKALAVQSILEVTENRANRRQVSGHCAANDMDLVLLNSGVGSLLSIPKLKSAGALTQGSIARAALMMVGVAAIWTAMTVPATAQAFPGIGIVMTYNVNEGTDFEQVVGTTSVTDFLLGVGQVITQVQGTNPPERMRAVAGQILSAQPELLSIQEVDQWFTGTYDPVAGTCGTMTLEYDMLKDLLNDLTARGGQIGSVAPET